MGGLLEGEVVFIFKKSSNKLILPADANFGIVFVDLHTCTDIVVSPSSRRGDLARISCM